MLFLVVVIMIIELAMMGYLFHKIFRHKSLTLKDTFIYPFMLLITTIIVYICIQTAHLSSGFWKDLAKSLSASVDIVKLSTDEKLISVLENVSWPDKAILINYYLSYFISLFALFSLSFTLLRITILNKFKIYFTPRKEKTYIFGFNDDAKNFIKNLTYDEKKKCIVVLDSTGLEKYVDEKIFLNRYKVPYIFKKYSFVTETKKTIYKLTKGKKKYNIITFFDDESKNITFISLVKELFIEKEYYGGYWRKEIRLEENNNAKTNSNLCAITLDINIDSNVLNKIDKNEVYKKLEGDFNYNLFDIKDLKYDLNIEKILCILCKQYIYGKDNENLKPKDIRSGVLNKLKKDFEGTLNSIIWICKINDNEPIYWNYKRNKNVFNFDDISQCKFTVEPYLGEKCKEDSPYDIEPKLFTKQNNIFDFILEESSEIKKINNNKILLDLFCLKYDIESLYYSPLKDVNVIISCNKNQEEMLNNLIVNEEIVEKNNERIGQFKEYIYGNWKYLMERDKENIDYSFGMIKTFNKYDVISLDFLKKHSFARYIKADNINDDCTLNNCDINLYVLGLGKVNESILRDVIINNQFAERSSQENTYNILPKRINVNVYDENKKLESIDLSSGFLKYKKSNYNEANYFELPDELLTLDDIHNYKSVEEANFLNDIYENIKDNANKGLDISPDRKQYNFFIISLNTDSVNWNIANIIQENISNINGCYNIFFVRTKEYQEAYFDIEYFSDKNMYPFGFEYSNIGGYLFYNKKLIKYENAIKKDIALSYGNVVKNQEYAAAKNAHYMYNKHTWAYGIETNKKKTNNKEVEIKFYEDKMNYDWSLLSRFKQKSNLYAALGVYSKLSLLKINNLNEFSKIYKESDPIYKLDNIISKKNHSIAEVMAFLEHERWNAFEMGFGVLPMKISQVVQLTNNNYHKFMNEPHRYRDDLIKDIGTTYHACITTQKGLNDYYNYFSSKNFKHGIDYSFDNNKGYKDNADVIRYDYDIMDFYAQVKYVKELEKYQNNVSRIDVKGNDSNV